MITNIQRAYGSILFALLVGAFTVASAAAADSQFATPPPKLQLKPCQSSPNCVSSTDQRASFHVDAFVPLEPLKPDWWQSVQKTLLAQRGFKLLGASDTYLHLSFTSRIMKFVDDVELRWDKAQSRVQIRSASRVGYYDLGANRRRVEHIHEWLRQQQLVK